MIIEIIAYTPLYSFVYRYDMIIKVGQFLVGIGENLYIVLLYHTCIPPPTHHNRHTQILYLEDLLPWWEPVVSVILLHLGQRMEQMVPCVLDLRVDTQGQTEPTRTQADLGGSKGSTEPDLFPKNVVKIMGELGRIMLWTSLLEVKFLEGAGPPPFF